MRVSRRAAAAIAATALTAALLPLTAGAVQADPSGPSFGYVTYAVDGVQTSATGKLWATTPGNLAASTALTPSSYVHQYDVSEDGNVLLVAGQSRAVTSHFRNTTYGLTLTVRDPITTEVTTKVLATYFEANPALSRDGSKAFWYDFGRVYRYDVATGAIDESWRFPTFSLTTTREEARRIAVSPDGSKVAVLIAKYDFDGNLVSTRVKAATFADGGTAYEEKVAYTATSVSPVSQLLTWNADGSAFYYAREKPDLSVETVRATTVADSDVVVPAWQDVYDVTTHQGTFYMFRDVYDSGTGEFSFSEVGSAASETGPADWTTFPPGETSVRYRAATVTPPAVTLPVTRAVPTIRFETSLTSVPTNGTLRYGTWAVYLNDVTGFYREDQGRATRYGVLSKSTDGGATFTKLATTSGTSLVSLGSTYANGYTTALTRNTWLKWCFAGDIFVQAGCSTVKKITVLPTIAYAVERSGTQKRIYGKAARVGGKAVLQKLSSGVYRTVTSATISSTGRFSFGLRTVPTGKYRVITLADATWGQGAKVFLI